MDEFVRLDVDDDDDDDGHEFIEDDDDRVWIMFSVFYMFLI